MSDEKENRGKSSAPRVSRLRRTQSFRDEHPFNDVISGITDTRSMESNPAVNILGSVGTPKADKGTLQKPSKPLNTVQGRRLLWSDFKPLAFSGNLPQATRADRPLSPLIITVHLSGPDPTVTADFRNKYFRRPKMFTLWSGDGGRLVSVQFQIWVPYPFKHFIDSMALAITRERLFDMNKLVQMSHIVADVVSPGKITIEVGASGQEAESNVSDFASCLQEMLDRGETPDNLRKIYPAFSLDVEDQKELSLQPCISEVAEASRELCHFFNRIGRSLRKILNCSGGISEARGAKERLGEIHVVFHHFSKVVEKTEPEENEENFEMVLEALSTTVDSITDLKNLGLPLKVADLHQLKSAVLKYVWSDIAAQRAMLTYTRSDLAAQKAMLINACSESEIAALEAEQTKIMNKRKMRVILARDFSYEMYRCAFPNPQKIKVKYTRTARDD